MIRNCFVLDYSVGGPPKGETSPIEYYVTVRSDDPAVGGDSSEDFQFVSIAPNDLNLTHLSSLIKSRYGMGVLDQVKWPFYGTLVF